MCGLWKEGMTVYLAWRYGTVPGAWYATHD
jgi:hypothetical protein